MDDDERINENIENAKKQELSSRPDLVNFAKTPKISQDEKFGYLPPTGEQWSRLPEWLKWWIFAQVLFYSWESVLADIGLKLGGLNIS